MVEEENVLLALDKVELRSADPGPRSGGSGAVPNARRRPPQTIRPSAPTAIGVSRVTAWMVAAATVLALSRAHNTIPLLLQVRGMLVLLVLALTGVILESQRWKPENLLKHWIPGGVGLLGLIALSGIPFSVHRGGSFTFFVDGFLPTLLLGLMVWAVTRTLGGLRFMTQAVTVGGLLTVVLALLHNRTDSEGRLTGASVYDPNDLALISVLSLPLVIWWSTDRKSSFRLWILGFVPILLLVIVRTDSRGGFLALAAAFVSLAMVGFLGSSMHLRRIALVGVFSAVAAAPFIPGDYLGRISTITSEDDYNRSADTGRIPLWRRGVLYALDRPLLGVGIGAFGAAEGRSALATARAAEGRGFKWGTAHSSYVLALAELGLVGGSIFMYLIIRSILSLTLLHTYERIRHPLQPPDLLPPCLGICLVAYAVGGAFLSLTYYDIVYVLLALTSNALTLRAEAPVGGTRPATAGTSRAGIIRNT